MDKKQKYLLLSFLVVINLLLFIGGYYYQKRQAWEIKNQKYSELESIANLKEKLITDWLVTQKNDCELLSKNPFFINAVTNFVQNKNSSESKKIFDELNKLISEQNHFEDIIIVNPQGKVSYSGKSEYSNIYGKTKEIVNGLIKTQQDFTSILTYCDVHKKEHFEVFSTIVKNGKTLAILIYRIDPSEFLFPLIQMWPTNSKTGETLLVQAEKDSVVFLNRLRHVKNNPLKFKISLQNKNIPAVRAVLGETGRFEGNDYRGIAVISELRKIKNTNWSLVTKEDLSEIYAELSDRTFSIYLTLFLLSGIITVLAYAYVRSTQKSHFEKLFLLERERRKEQEEFKATLYSVGDAVITTDSTGKVKRMNKVATQLTGWDESEALGKPVETVFNIINEESKEVVDSPIKKIIEHGVVVGLANHTLLVSKDGKETPIADSAAPIKTPDGNIIGVVLVFSDVTKQYEIQNKLIQSERLLRESQVVGNIGSFTLDIKSGIWISSKTLDEIFGINDSFTKNVEGWITIVHPEWKQIMYDYFVNEVLGKGKRFDKEYQIVRQNDNVVRWVHGYGELELDENNIPIRMIGTIQDVTEITEARLELEKYKNHLEEKVKERTAQLDLVNARLVEEIQKAKDYELLLSDSLKKEKEINELKTRFISTVSHEFRTPLMSIQLSADLLRRYIKSNPDVKMTNQLNSIQNSIQVLTKLLDDILTISRAETGKEKCEPTVFDLEAEVKSIIEEGNVYKKDNHNFVLRFQPKRKEFSLDKRLIRHILMNLISNAYKYSPDGGEIILEIFQSGGMLNFKITDHGIGFGGEVIDNLFEPFFRAKNAIDISGSGLGLSIVKKAVELHSGMISYSSEPGVGTVFHVKIPIL